MKLSAFPILRLLIPYTLGIICGYFCPFCKINPLFFLISIPIILTLSSIFNTKLGYYRQKIAIIGLLFSALLIGFTHTFLLFHYQYHIGCTDFNPKNQQWGIQFTEPLQPREKTIKGIGKLYDFSNNKTISGKVLLYLERDSLANTIESGDLIIVHTSLKEIASPQNPYAFDYKTFMQRKGVYFTGYVRKNNWQKIHTSKKWDFRRWAYRGQQKLSKILADAGIKGEEYAIATALLLGSDETMEPELKQAYASAGVSHILCVSGMHVGIIFMIINFLLQPLDYHKKLRFFKSGLLLITIWIYAHLTGLSPSVSRAATMFSFVIIGNHLHRNTNIFHSLFASLFILLCINPLLLFELGFQLSYLAVIGIVLLQPHLFNLFQCKYKITNYLWNLATVSIAAQITTFPLTIYYFGTFPNYFLLANLSVIALSFIVVISGVIVLTFSFLNIILPYLGKLLSWEIQLMNKIIFSIENLPYAVSNNININHLQMALLYIIILFLFLFYLKRKKWKLNSALIALAIFIIITHINQWQCTQEKNITIYALQRGNAISFNIGENNILLCDSLIQNSEKERNFAIKNHERKLQMKTKIIAIDSNFHDKTAIKEHNFVQFQGVKIYIHKDNTKLHHTKTPINVDIVWICNNAKQPLQELLYAIKPKIIVIDQSNNSYYEKKWRESCQKEQLPYYSIREEGKFYQYKITD